jgi:hypothetical protein
MKLQVQLLTSLFSVAGSSTSLSQVLFAFLHFPLQGSALLLLMYQRKLQRPLPSLQFPQLLLHI